MQTERQHMDHNHHITDHLLRKLTKMNDHSTNKNLICSIRLPISSSIPPASTPPLIKTCIFIQVQKREKIIRKMYLRYGPCERLHRKQLKRLLVKQG
ncbi:hypothetical protein Hdeb2414_s0016g00490601 [Helianthus debilis subsp. tardiflorus]